MVIVKSNVQKQIDDLCNKYNLPEMKSHITYDELLAKINYLQENSLEFSSNGKLNPLFNMSDINMQVTYGISKEDLVEQFAKTKESVK